MPSITSDRDNFPRIKTAINILIEEHGEFYAECVEVLAQYVVANSTLREMPLYKKDNFIQEFLNATDDSIKYFANRVANHFQLPILTVTTHIKTVALGAIEDSLD